MNMKKIKLALSHSLMTFLLLSPVLLTFFFFDLLGMGEALIPKLQGALITNFTSPPPSGLGRAHSLFFALAFLSDCIALSLIDSALPALGIDLDAPFPRIRTKKK